MNLRVIAAGILFVCVLISVIGFGCGDNSPKPPDPDSYDVTIPVGPDSSVVEHDEFVVTIPEGLFADSTDITVSIADEPLQNLPPDGVSIFSKVLTLQISTDDISDIPDSLVLTSMLELALPSNAPIGAYVRATVTAPGQESALLFGQVEEDDENQDQRVVKVPLAILAHAISESGVIEIEFHIATFDGGEYKSVPSAQPLPIAMQLYEATLSDPSEIELQRVDSQVGDLGNKRVLILVHGWSNFESLEFNDYWRKDKLKTYWGDAASYILSEAGDEFAVYCLYYDEDNALEDLSVEMAALISNRFHEPTNGKILVLAHSMGGLLTRAWVTNKGGSEKLEGAVFLDTPHHGSALADAWFEGIWLPSVIPFFWQNISLPESGAANIVYEFPMPGGGEGGNDFLVNLNNDDSSWDKYVCFASDYGGGIVLAAWYCERILERLHDVPEIEHDGVVELDSQLPEDVSTDFQSFEHSDHHARAPKNTDEVIPTALSCLREIVSGHDPDPIPGFVQIPAGMFTMGSPEYEDARESDETLHTATLTTPFNMSVLPITKQQYVDMAQWAYDRGYCTASNTSINDNMDGSTVKLFRLDGAFCKIYFDEDTFRISAGHENRSVGYVTWYGAVTYCDWLSLMEGIQPAYDHVTWQCNGHDPYSAEGYRLPTEAEWEYTCRAGTQTPYNPHNEWGVHSMSQWPSEWCNDLYGPYDGDEINPVGPEAASHTNRIRRGGLHGTSHYCRCAERLTVYSGYAAEGIGFRISRSIR
jgi:formylglycine-generating enzyme required for sulfatase activity/pimeloyl-ACP methyl ester carboxylesterase